MSNALVLTAVSAVLKYLLENGLVDHSVTTAIGSDTTVSALAPDRITTGSEEKPQLNIFLYQAVPKGLYTASRHKMDAEKPSSLGLPTAMEMKYLVSAYGAQDFQAESLLGYALQVMHKTSELSGDNIRTILSVVSSRKGGRMVSPILSSLSSVELGERFQSMKITPQNLDSQEMLNLWSSFQVCYRLSITYRVNIELTDVRQ